MAFDQAQSPRLGQRTQVESTSVQMFSGGEVPEAAWLGQLIYINEEQILQIYNGDAWEDVTGGDIGQLTFIGPTTPMSQSIGDVWFNSADANRMYVAKMVGSDEIKPGEWEVIRGEPPPITATTYIYKQDNPPTAASSPPPKENDFWYETPINKQYYYQAAAPGTHWVLVRDTGIDQAIVSSKVEYALSASETVAPSTGWSITAPARTPGNFIWWRTTTTKGDGSSVTAAAALLTGNAGAQGSVGQTGSQGIQGPKGADGVQLYTWLKYADTPSTGMADDPTNKTYMGLAYNKTSSTESLIYTDYDWSLIKGTAGVAGPAGADGTPRYTWIKYGTSVTGAGINDSPVGMSYIGIAYNKLTATESSITTDYEWALIQGPQGPQGPAGQAGSQGIPGPAGSNGQSLFTWLKYADTPTTGMSDSPAGKTYMGIAYNQASSTESLSYAVYDWSLIQGPQGNTGVAGPAGADGQPRYTWIKYADSVLGAGLSDSPVGKIYIGFAYNKTTPAESTVTTDYEWALIQGPQGPAGQAGSQGIQGPKGADGGSLYTWLKYADTPTTGMSDSPAGKTYMGIAYNQANATESLSYGVYDWSLIQGAQGNTGVAGPAGADGQPRYTWVKYADSATGAGINDLPAGKTYIGFAYNKTSATESNVTTDYEWALIQGPQGSQGIQGPKGADGVQYYTWLKYADTPTTGMNDSPVGKTYMGIAYNKTSATESSLYGDYDWSLIVGPSGAQGVQGVQGPTGPNGAPTYTWIKYGTSYAGAGINDSPVGMSYIGIAYNKSTAVESNLPTDYEWSLILGPQGVQGPKGADGVQYYTWIKYADTPTTGMNDLPAGKTYMGIAYNKVSATESSLYTDYEWSLIVGPQGNTGVAGPAGANGQPTYTWIKYADSVLGAGLSDSPVGKNYLGIAYNKTVAAESTVTTDYDWSLIVGPQGPQGNTGATGPTGPPGLPGASAAPPASPALTLIPQDNGFVVQTGPIDIYSNLTYHCSTTTNFAPGAGTVVLANTRNQNVLITAQNGGAAFVRGTTYYFKVIEANNIGAAAASAQVSGQLRVWSQTDIPDLFTAVNNSNTALATANAAVVQDSLSSNPMFLDWPIANPRPTGWTTTSAPSGSTFTRETTLVRTPPCAVRFNVLPVTQTYIACAAGGAWSTLPNLEYITVTFDFMLVAGDLNNAGAMIRWVQDVSFKVVYIALNSSFTSGPPTLGQWYRVTRTIQRPALSGAFVRIDPYLCGGYSLIEAGSVTAKDIIFDQFSVRPSTAEEITAYNTPGSIAKASTDLQAYVQSRSYNLVTNGGGAMGTNQNFSSLTFNAADTPPGATGSFYFPSGVAQGARFNDELIPVDPNKVYELACDFRQVTGQANFFIGYYCFDAYGLSISPVNYAAQANTLTTLAVALNPGATTITLTSSANWFNGAGATTYLRSMITWDYVDQGGKAWAPNTYSRNWYGDIWNQGGITGNVITLKVPWAGPVVAAGTPVSNGFNGGTYMYNAVNNKPATPDWTHYSGRTSKGPHPSGTPAAATTNFPLPAAKVKIAMLTNYAPLTQPSQMAIANVALTEVTAGDDALAAAGAADGKASLAQTTADGKNRVNYGTTAPGATSPGKPGDIWWVQVGATITGQYLCTVGTGVNTGNTWVAQTLTNSTIATLDAVKINTGFLNSARIDVNSLNVGQISGLGATLNTLWEMTPIPTLTNNVVAGTISWPAFTIKHGGITLSVPLGSTANSWVIYRWNAGAPLIEQSDNQPVMGTDDFILFANHGGAGLRIFATVLVSGDMVVDGTLAATALAAKSITADQLNSTAINASMIQTGTMKATVIVGGSLAVGTGITIDPTGGIQVSGPLGISTIPASGAGMVLKGELTASALNISGNFKMTGTTNEIATGSSMVVQAGITPPSNGPQITAEYPTHEILAGVDPRGLVAFPAESASTWLMTDNTTKTLAQIVKLTKQANGDYTDAAVPFDCILARSEIRSCYGGITALGTEVYTLCETTTKIPGTSNFRWYIYQWHYTGTTTPGQSRFTYVNRYIYEPSTNYGGYSSWIPAIGTDGTDLLIYQNGVQGWGVSRYSAAGVFSTTIALWNDAAKTDRVNAFRNGGGIIGTAADTGTVRWWITTTGAAQVYCFEASGVNIGVRVTGNEFTAPSQPMLSLHWDGTRFAYRDTSKVYDFSQIQDNDLATNPVKAVQTWRLNNDSDAGGDTGDYATYETARSGIVSTSVALVKRSWMRLTSTVPIPDDPSDINDPDSLTFYVARGATPAPTDFKRVPPFTGANKALTTVLRDTIPTTGGNPPAITAWGPVTSGKVQSAGLDGINNPIWSLQGSGVWRMGPFSGGANGLQTSRVPVCLGRWRSTGSLTAALGTEFAVGNVNNISLRTGMSYRMEWRALVSNGTAASTSQTFFKYGNGLVLAGGTTFGEGQLDHRAATKAITVSDFAVLDWIGADNTVVNFVATIISAVGVSTVQWSAPRAALLEIYEYPT